MTELRAKMRENGRIVIPADFRRQLHIKPGEEFIMRLEDGELRIFSLEHSIKRAQSLVKKYAQNKSLVKALKNLRQQENKNE